MKWDERKEEKNKDDHQRGQNKLNDKVIIYDESGDIVSFSDFSKHNISIFDD
jgi:hypothetical protein